MSERLGKSSPKLEDLSSPEVRNQEAADDLSPISKEKAPPSNIIRTQNGYYLVRARRWVRLSPEELIRVVIPPTWQGRTVWFTQEAELVPLAKLPSTLETVEGKIEKCQVSHSSSNKCDVYAVSNPRQSNEQNKQTPQN